MNQCIPYQDVCKVDGHACRSEDRRLLRIVIERWLSHARMSLLAELLKWIRIEFGFGTRATTYSARRPQLAIPPCKKALETALQESSDQEQEALRRQSFARSREILRRQLKSAVLISMDCVGDIELCRKWIAPLLPFRDLVEAHKKVGVLFSEEILMEGDAC